MSRPKHVIYVEESSILRETLSAALEINGFRATTCGDARTAWNHIHEEGCDLLLLDIELRRGTGMALFRKVRDNQPTRTMPVVLLTGCTNADTIREAIAFRPRKLLVKSNFSLERLLEVIRESTEERPAGAPASSNAPAPSNVPEADAEAGMDPGVDSPVTAAAPASPAPAPAPAAAAAPTPPPAPAPVELPPITRDQLAQKQDERDKITQRLKELA